MSKHIIEKSLNEGKGIFKLAPTWVPRVGPRPGRRLRLHPHDYYHFGLERGPVDERWLASTVHALNGEKTPPDEGLSYILADKEGKERATLLEAVSEYKEKIIGKDLWDKYARWSMFSKLFDNMGPLQLHIHQGGQYASAVNQYPKPEMYYYPAQYNGHYGEVPVTYFGLHPGVTKDDVKKALMMFDKGENRILELSQGYRLALDTGFDLPAGVLHAPGSLCTYEPQYASDIGTTVESILYGDHVLNASMLWGNCPKDKVGNFDYIIEMLDWEANTDIDIYRKRFMYPIHIETGTPDYYEEWICYKSPVAAAKKIVVKPGKTVISKEPAPYGIIAIQGYGMFGEFKVETPSMIRFGELTSDEFFVIQERAKDGVKITNVSDTEDLVILKHFAEHKERPLH